MIKTLGFLTGVCLTVAAFMLMLDRWQLQGDDDAPLTSVASNVKPVDVVNVTADETLASEAAKSTSNAINERVDAAAISDSSTDVMIQTVSVHDIKDPDKPVTEAQPSESADSKQQTTDAMPAAGEQPVTGVIKMADTPSDNPEPLALERASRQAIGASTPPQAYVFWSPFRSEWAAKGFARRLSNATQIPIEIVEEGSVQFRVSFDYQDESQRLEHLERIEFITGLQLE